MKDGHPTKGSYWFPAYNSSAGIKAMQFIKDQINAGIKPIANGNDDEISLVNRIYAAFLEGILDAWGISPNLRSNLIKNVGFIPMYPTPKKDVQTTTVMGVWELSIPELQK